MFNHQKTQNGFTILEVMLTVAIASTLILSGYSLYASYRADVDVMAVKANVDTLAQAASLYYYANCYGNTSPSTGVVSGGNLYSTTVAQSIPFGVDLATLRSSGYLTAPIQRNSLVDNSATDGGYIVEFVRNDSTRRACLDTACTSPATTGTNLDYKIVIGVRMADASKITTYQGALEPSCVSSAQTNQSLPSAAKGTLVASCSNSSFTTQCMVLRALPNIGPPGYKPGELADVMGCPASASASSYSNILVYERSPAYANSKGTDNWQANRVVDQFTQQYRSLPIQHLTSHSHSPEYQYFRCGD